MKTARKIPKNFTFDVQFVALAILVRKDYTWDVMPLNIRSDCRFLKANSTKAKRIELMKKVKIIFD